MKYFIGLVFLMLLGSVVYSNEYFYVNYKNITHDGDGVAASAGIENDSGVRGITAAYGDNNWNWSQVGIRYQIGPDYDAYENWNYTWENMNNASNLTYLNLTDDQVSDGIDMGFYSHFFGTTINRIWVSSNGFIIFDNWVSQNLSSGCCSGQYMPDGTAPNYLIAGYWEDLNPEAGGTISYGVFGSAPNRYMVVEFNEVPHYYYTNATVSFQIKIPEQ
ncbi:hypothetical protein HY988_02040 [Candidatus Micrarchaeota archaeon]|nr:hypothetical protein [Candidatus Micrarchaeota archaeon]